MVVCLGAMENWGLVTYREVTLLVDPTHSSAAAKQTVALVVGHELAHQWFGNLVTMVHDFIIIIIIIVIITIIFLTLVKTRVGKKLRKYKKY